MALVNENIDPYSRLNTVLFDRAYMRSKLQHSVAFISVLLYLCVTEGALGTQGAWTEVDSVLQNAISQQAFPGCVALVGTSAGIVYQKAFGHYTYGDLPPYFPPGHDDTTTPPMELETRFDMASCTKVVATLSAVGLLYDMGLLALNTRLSDPSLLGPAFAVNGKENITVLNCLLHNAGFPPDPHPNYWDKEFGCPETSRLPHPLENFSCRDQIFAAIYAQDLVFPIGSKYIYSDLSFMSLMLVVGTVAKNYAEQLEISPLDLHLGCEQHTPSDIACYYEAFVRKWVFEQLGMEKTSHFLAEVQWGECAPCENDTVYTHKVIQGQVSDGNAYAMGGIAGHAGLFSTAPDLSRLMRSLLYGDPFWFLKPSTMDFFSQQFNHSQSSRAIGWNTNDPSVFDGGWNQSCLGFSAATFLHTGYTGTEICADPTRKVYTILLTNRVYPIDLNSTLIHAARQAFNLAVVKALDAEDRQFAMLQEAYQNFLISPATDAATSTARFPFPFKLEKQCDPAWAQVVMEVHTICQVGCLMTSVSMALVSKNIRIGKEQLNPRILNEFLRNHHGYVDGDNLDEDVVSKINPAKIKYSGSQRSMTRSQLIDRLECASCITIANVDGGGHFVLVTGYDTNPALSDVWYVNDPGFNRPSYRTADIVGFRLFSMQT